MKKIKAIRGFKDVLPDQAPIWRAMEKAARDVADRFGYDEMRIPVVERTDLFARSIGQDTDIVEKEMYTFPDRRGDSLTLRPEATAGVVRALIEHNLAADGRPWKVFFLGPMFRYERPQKGRQRQFHQLDVEAFNAASPHMDAEIIVILAQFLAELGLTDVEMHLNSLGCPRCRPGYKDQLNAFLADKADQLCPDCQRRRTTNPLRVVDCKVPGCQEAAAGAPAILDALCEDCAAHFNRVQEDLTAVGVRFSLDHHLVRGLDYYTRTTFEAQTGELGAQNAVAGGGRYDGLVEALGGSPTPAIGFAVGLERLAMLLSERGGFPAKGPDLYIAALDEAAIAHTLPLAMNLRRMGLRVAAEYEPGGLKSRMKRADKLNAARTLIVGPEELAQGVGILRNMTDKTQIEAPLSDVQQAASFLVERINKENGH